MSGIRLSPDVLYRDLDGQAVILDLSSGRYFGLNQVATRIWTLIGDGLDTAAIVATLSREFDADVATIERDLRDLLDALSSRRLIVPTDDRHP